MSVARSLLAKLFWIVLFVRLLGIAWYAFEAPVYMVGDFATDYFPRARYFAENGVFATVSEVERDFYLRPPLYSLLLAPLAALDTSGEDVVRYARLINALSESAVLGMLALFVLRWFKSASVQLMAFPLLILQPFTSGHLLTPGPDTLLMFLLTYLTIACVEARVKDAARRHEIVCIGMALLATVMLRAEMVLLCWIFPLLWMVGRWPLERLRSLRVVGYLVAFGMSGVLINAAYSLHAQGAWNLWAGGQQSFTDMPSVKWVRSWRGNEVEKSNIAWYWYRGEHFSMNYVPKQAIVEPSDRDVIALTLQGAMARGALSDEDNVTINMLAERNKRARPVDWYLWIPVGHAGAMWIDHAVLPVWTKALHLVNWRIPALAALFCSTAVVVGLLGAILLLRQRNGGFRFAVGAALFVCATRTLVFCVTIPMPEARYVVSCWPSLLLVALFGLNALILYLQERLWSTRGGDS